MTIASSAVASHVPPCNLDAERAVLGCCLLEGRATVEHLELEATAFYLEAHRILFAAMRALAERGEAVSILTVEAELRDLGQLEAVGGPAHLALCLEEAAVGAYLPEYVGIVRRHAARREGIQACTQAIGELFGNGRGPAASVADVAQRLTERLARLAGLADPSARAVPIGEVLDEVAAYLDAPKSARSVLRSPIPELDRRLEGGALPGEVIYLGGRPGTSKTSLALQWAALAAHEGHRTLVISREMRALALGRRFVAQQLRIPAGSLRRADLWPDERARFETARVRLGALPLWFADQAATIQQVRRLTRLVAPRLLVVDYVQLVESPADARAGKRLEVTAVSRALKRLATERGGCTVLALSSLRRPDEGGKGRGAKSAAPPLLESLKESGDLEADADVVILLWSRETNGRDRQLTFAKVRDGQGGGTVELDWDPVFVQFNQLPGQNEEPGAREAGSDDVPF